jgi:outer membrane receptor protein involved in Fe transport
VIISPESVYRSIILIIFVGLFTTHSGAQFHPSWRGGTNAGDVPSVYLPVSFTFHQIPLREALLQFSKHTGINLVYSLDSERLKKTVSASIISEPPIAALYKILNGTGLDILLASSGRIVLVPQIQFVRSGAAISGEVVDNKTGIPIPRANILIKELHRGTVTDEEGLFEIDNIPYGDYTLRATHVSYEPGEQHVAVSNGSDHKQFLMLNPAVFELGEIFIDDNNARIHNGGLGVSGINIEPEQIDRTGGMWIGQVLRSRVAGLTFLESGFSSGSGYLQFRGVGSFHNPSDYMRINVDGIPVDGIYWETFITDNLSRIEVLRGPQASGQYGASAMSGVINLFTDTGRPGEIQARISAAGGLAKNSAKDFDPLWQEYFGSVGGGTDVITSGITMRHTRDEGILVNRGSRLSALTAGTKVKPSDKFSIRATFRFTELDSGWPYAQNIQVLSTFPILNPEVSSRQHRGIASINLDLNLYTWWEQRVILGTEYLNGRLDYRTTEGYTGGDQYPIRRQLIDISERDVHIRPTFHYNTKFSLPVGENNHGSFSAGFEIQREDRSRDVKREHEDVFERMYKNQTEQSIIGKYLSWSFTSNENLEVAFGMRMDQIQAEGEVFTYPISPSLNLGYRFGIRDNWIGIFRASMGRGIRHPHYSMIFGQAPVEIPNPELRAEIMDGWETGITNFLMDGKLAITTTYFVQETKDAFQPVPVTEQFASYKWVNAGKVTNRGLEVETFVTTSDWIQFGLAYIFHWNRAIDLRQNEAHEYTLLRVPDRAGSFFFALRPLKNLVLNADVYYVGERLDVDMEAWHSHGRIFRLTNYERMFESYTKIDLTGKYVVFEDYELFVNIFNLLNDLTREYGGYRPAGRMIIIGMRYSI